MVAQRVDDEPSYVSAEAYLAMDRRAATKSEWFDGHVRAMSGASLTHNRLSVNLLRELLPQLGDGPCEVFNNDMRTQITEGSLYAYPDIVVVCGEPELADGEFDVLLNPTLIIEVLSDSTEAWDRGLKFER